MPSVAIYNQLNGRLLRFITSVDPSPYMNRPDVLVFDDRSTPTERAMQDIYFAVRVKYLKVALGALVEMTAEEKAVVDAEAAADLLLSLRSEAKNLVDCVDSISKVLRAEADVLKDEINLLRQWLVSFKAEVAASTSLANLQTRVATLPNLPDRTLAQLKSAIKDRIDSGLVD